MVLHVLFGAKKCLHTLQNGLLWALINALKGVIQVQRGQAGNIARAQVQRDENGGTSGTLRRLYVVG